MIELIDYKQAHGREVFRENKSDDAQIEAWFDQPSFDGWLVELEEPGQAFTAIDRDVGVLAIGGIVTKWVGVGEAWLVPSSGLRERPVAGTRLIKRHMAVLQRQHSYWRLQINVHVENEQALRFAKWLGFLMEGEMIKYGPDGKNYYRMARVV